jgi:hypothetical protein
MLATIFVMIVLLIHRVSNITLVCLTSKKMLQEPTTSMPRYQPPPCCSLVSLTFLTMQATFGPKAKTNFVYEPGESIVPSDFLMMQPPVEASEDSTIAKVKGSHPRRTYVGIKARRKRMSESEGRVEEGGMHGNERLAISTLSNHSLTNSSAFMMPPRKRLRHAGLSNAASAGMEGDGTSDWREQLYHWRGHLSMDSSVSTSGDATKRSVLLWSGTWVGSWQQVAGSESTLAWTGNTFTYRGPQVAEEQTASMSVPLKPVSGSFLGHYMMDNEGSGRLSRYSDSTCYLDFKDDENAAGKYTVIGRGDSDFGAFILQGTYDSASRALDLTRKYIPDSDPRSGEKISLHELRASLIRDPVKVATAAPIGMLGAKSLDVVSANVVVPMNKEIEI